MPRKSRGFAELLRWVDVEKGGGKNVGPHDQKTAGKPAAVAYLKTAISYTCLEFELTFLMV